MHQCFRCLKLYRHFCIADRLRHRTFQKVDLWLTLGGNDRGAAVLVLFITLALLLNRWLYMYSIVIMNCPISIYIMNAGSCCDIPGIYCYVFMEAMFNSHKYGKQKEHLTNWFQKSYITRSIHVGMYRRNTSTVLWILYWCGKKYPHAMSMALVKLVFNGDLIIP